MTHEPTGIPALSVAGAARGLGVAPGTLRSWERRYGLVPSLHTAGGHRRYGPTDLARLQVMHRLVRDGVPPGEAAKVAIRAAADELELADGPYAALLSGAAAGARADRLNERIGELRAGDLPAGRSAAGPASLGPASPGQAAGPESANPAAGSEAVVLETGGSEAVVLEAVGPEAVVLETGGSEAVVLETGGSEAVGPEAVNSEAGGSAGGGRVLALPGAARAVRGLARAAMALDSHSCHRSVTAALAAQGAIGTWDQLIRPVLAAAGDRWERTGLGVEIEHSFSIIVAGALAAHAAQLARPSNDRPILLASVPGEAHDLPLLALQAALADAGIRSHVLGAATPEQALAAAVARLGPPVVFLWAQMGGPAMPELPAQRPGPTLVVGGPGWAELDQGTVRVDDLVGAVAAIRAAVGQG